MSGQCKSAITALNLKHSNFKAGTIQFTRKCNEKLPENTKKVEQVANVRCTLVFNISSDLLFVFALRTFGISLAEEF